MDQAIDSGSNKTRNVIIVGVLLTAILLIAAFLRFRGLLWGEYQYLHPDERFLVWVGTDISPVNSLAEYWDTDNSSLNPHNEGHGFYVYGTLPLYIARYAVEWVYGQSGFNEMTNVGRFLSALVDLLTVLLVYLVGAKVYKKWTGVLAAGFSAFAVLQIQLSHFFTVDTFTTFFTMLAVYFAVRVAYDQIDLTRYSENYFNEQLSFNDQKASRKRSIISSTLTYLSKLVRNPFFLLTLGFGVALGLAASSKVSAAPVALLLPGAFFIRLFSVRGQSRRQLTQQILAYLFLAGVVSLLVFRILQPMAFSGPGFFGITPNEAWIANLRELQTQTNGDVDFPPALQWARRPVWFAWENMVRWGMGLPFGLLAWAGYLWIGWRMIKGEWRKHILLWGWTTLIFVWQSLVFNPSMRYQLPIYPILAIFAAWVVLHLYNWGRTRVFDNSLPSSSQITDPYDEDGIDKSRSNNLLRFLAIAVGGVALIATAIYAYSFSNIYTRPITRIDASRWIYQNIPGPVDLHIQSEDELINQHIPYSHNYLISQDLPFISGFTPRVSGELAEINIAKISNPYTNFGEKDFRLTIAEIPGKGGQSESVALSTGFYPSGNGDIDSSTATLEKPLELVANQQYYFQLGLPASQAPIIFNGELVITIQGEKNQNESILLTDALISSSNTYRENFISPIDGLLTDVELKVLQPDEDDQPTLNLTISSQPDFSDSLASAKISKDSEGDNGYRILLDNPLYLEEEKEFFLKINMEDSEGGIILSGAPIANEGAWDDGLPVRLDGYDGFAGIYEPDLNFDMYEDDNLDKLARFYEVLDHADYILISSSRQWGTLPRIPERFPMNSEYYRSLLGCPLEKSIEWCYNFAKVGDFQGDLGFELIEVFESNPSFSSFGFNDQASEEAFTVYDHPKVFIFRKTPDYDPVKVREILGAVDLSKVVHITPKKASDLPKDMMLPLDRLTSQLTGGTWSQLFNIDSIINRSPSLTVIIWYLVVAFLGIIAYPILRFALPGLEDRGYPLSRTASMLLLSFFVWLAGSIKIPFTRPIITLVVIVLLGISVIMIYLQRSGLRREWRERRTYFLVIEGLFLAFFIFDLLIRIGNPDLWHPWKGGEKPMDFSYLNAVLKSTSFPPYDPWFSGGYINYYYYGFVYVGVLVKWLGIVPSVAYNLIIPTLFSMIAMGAFSIGWNLISLGRSTARNLKVILKSYPFITGIAAALAVAVLGNLGTLRMIYQGYQRLAAPGGNIEGANLFIRIIWAAKGAFMTLTGSSMPYGIADWYWLPSRAIPAPNDIEPITEFPFFTVLYGDPHAHLFALPLTLLALAWALSILFAKGWNTTKLDTKLNSILRVSISLFIGALAIGALRPTNTWDFPIYLVFGLLAVGYAVWGYGQRKLDGSGSLNNLSSLIKRGIFAVGAVILLGLLAFILYQPYAHWYVQGYTNIQLWKGPYTPFWSYLTHWGVFLFVIIAWLVWETREWMAETPLSKLRRLFPYRGSLIIGGLLLLGWIITLLVLGVSIAWFVIPIVIWACILLFRPGLSDAKKAVLVMIAAGLSLTLMVEIIVLVGDIGRMNTVFKFYLQVWTLLAVSAAASFGWTLASIARWSPTWRSIWQIAVIILVSSAALYPLLGGTAKIKDRMTESVPLTLDGMAFMEYSEYEDLGETLDLSQDYRAIRWLQENVPGSPVIIEGNMVEYHWGSRNSIYTGLPSVIGWNWHQRQQRALNSEELVQGRISDVNEFYLSSDPDGAKSILDQYDVKYIVVGQLERALYPGSGLNKFDSLEGTIWQAVYRDGETVIYQVLE
jgi:YYY domain-containing protein